MPKIPNPEYVIDMVDGAIYDVAGKPILALHPSALSGAIIVQGTFAIRYAIPLLTPPSQAVIPGLFVGERGGALVGREGWEYMQDRFQMHPRADVIGLYLDGTRAEVWIRDLDFGAKVRVFAYRTAQDVVPLTELFGFSAGEGAALPDFIQRYLPAASGKSISNTAL